MPPLRYGTPTSSVPPRCDATVLNDPRIAVRMRAWNRYRTLWKDAAIRSERRYSRPTLRICAIRLWLLAICGLVPGTALAQQPLHVRIDHLISQSFSGAQPALPTDDAAFLRRVSLDLAGCIPSRDQLEQFLSDTAPDKRVRVIDQLLSAPTYAEHMQQLFGVMWMERRGKNEDWSRFLHKTFEDNVPWDVMVRRIIRPDETQEDARGAAFFYTKRLESYGENPVDYPGLTRDIGRLFLGVDLQCAQCHDHLFVQDYKQLEFQGLHALVQQLSIRTDVNFPALQEKSIEKKLEFISVFQPERKETGPRVPFGKELAIAIPPGDRPPSSSLQMLADELANAQNPWFVRNAVNRLWFVLLGRGLIHPLDMHHSENPPSHPELVDLLSNEFVAHGMDIRWLLREIALTDTYQRSSIYSTTEAIPPPNTYLTANEKRISAEQLLRSFLRATGEESRFSQPQNEQALQALRQQFEEALANEPREAEVAYEPTVKGALFLLNDQKVWDLLQPREGNLLQQLAAIEDPKKMADALYLQVFSRLPTDVERGELQEYFSSHAEQRDVALRYYVWAMLSSVEFCVNH